MTHTTKTTYEHDRYRYFMAGMLFNDCLRAISNIRKDEFSDFDHNKGKDVITDIVRSTNFYLTERYGLEPLTEAEFEHIRQFWSWLEVK